AAAEFAANLDAGEHEGNNLQLNNEDEEAGIQNPEGNSFEADTGEDGNDFDGSSIEADTAEDRNDLDGSSFEAASAENSSDGDGSSMCDFEMHYLREEPEGNQREDPNADPDDPDEPDEEYHDENTTSEEESDSDLENDDNFNFDHATLNQPVVMTRVPTVREMLMLDLALSVRHKQTYECLIDTYEAKNVAFGKKYFPTSKKELWRILGRNSSGIVEHVYCTRCGGYIAEKRKLGNLAVCPNAGCNFQTETSKAKYFITLSLKKQLQHFLETPGIPDLLKYRDNRTKRSATAIEDVYDSEGYKNLNLGPFDLSGVLNTDGCKIRKGAKLDIYPVFVRLNELPPELRQKYIFLSALYVDTKEPKMTSLLYPVVNQLNSLSETGVLWRPAREQNQIQSKFKVHCCCVDGKARYQVLNMSSHQATYGCTYCTIKGVSVGDNHTMRWPIREHPEIPAYEDRTHQGMVQAMIDVHRNLQPEEQGLPLPRPVPILGHKGPTPLMLLHDFDLRRSNACDDLHILYECAAKHATDLVLKEAPRVQEAMGLEVLCDLIDGRLQLIKTPTNISRKPGTCSIKNRKQFKGSEWRNWIIYFAVPCLQGLVVQEHITPLELLSRGAFLVSQDIIEPQHIQEAKECFHAYLELNEELYGIERTKLNLHALIHFSRCIVDNGNLWCYSTFNFESWNHKIIQKVTSPQGALLQIVVRHLILTSLELALHSEDDNISRPVKEQLLRILKKRRLARAVQFSSKVYLLGKVTYRSTTEAERQVLERENFHNIQRVQEYKKIIIGSTVYVPVKNVTPLTKSDNSMVYTYKDTFCSVQSVVRFQYPVDEPTDVCGLFVSEHSVTPQCPFKDAKHISCLLEPDHDLCYFILPEDVRSIVVQMPLNGEIYVVPLPNLFEID
ncbi:Halomucin, partial [Frankliniella fusca]